MARFIAEIEGQSGRPTTRLGSQRSGVRAVANGWDCGVKVYSGVDEKGRDYFEVILTGGSHKSRPDIYLAKIIEEPIGEPPTVLLDPFHDVEKLKAA